MPGVLSRRPRGGFNVLPADHHDQNSPLLCLPAELRNQKYRYTLLESDPISVATQTREPALLQVCRQIHTQSLKVYWDDNTFSVPIINCAASLCGALFETTGTHFQAN